MESVQIMNTQLPGAEYFSEVTIMAHFSKVTSPDDGERTHF
jgi:hypothetical protein